MRAPRLRSGFADAYRQARRPSMALTAEAERAIRRRVTRRWTARSIAAAAAGAVLFVGANTLVAATSATDTVSSATPSPSASQGPLPRLATFPLDGGPEFQSLEDYPICGTPVPETPPSDEGFSISAGVRDAIDPWPNQNVAVLTAHVTSDDDVPRQASRGPLWVVLSRDGEVAGAVALAGTDIQRATTPNIGGANIEVPTYAEIFQCRKVSASGPREYDLVPVEPGTYTAVAYTRIFATEESVALGQTVPPWIQLAEDQKLPGGVYAPGSFDCGLLLDSYSIAVRACLPDIVPGAVVDESTQTVSMMYDPEGFEMPFDTTLVSEPFDITLASWEDDSHNGSALVTYLDPTQFAKGSDVVCGAEVNDYQRLAPTQDAQVDGILAAENVSVEAMLPALELAEAVTVNATVMPWFAPDGSSVRLDAGARVVYFRNTGPSESGWPDYKVVGFAPVEMLGVIPHDRYRGPTEVQLHLGDPQVCPGIDDGGSRLTGTQAILGTWTVTPPDGPPMQRELLTSTSGPLGSSSYVIEQQLN